MKLETKKAKSREPPPENPYILPRRNPIIIFSQNHGNTAAAINAATATKNHGAKTVSNNKTIKDEIRKTNIKNFKTSSLFFFPILFRRRRIIPTSSRILDKIGTKSRILDNSVPFDGTNYRDKRKTLFKYWVFTGKRKIIFCKGSIV